MKTVGPAVAEFFRRFEHEKGPMAGRTFEFEPWQQDFVNEFFRVDDQGRRVYRLGILGIPRGNGKSPMAAGFGLFELVSRDDSPDVFCAAGSRDQARVVFNFARSFAESGTGLRDALKPGKSAIHYDANKGVMKVLAAQGSLQHGLSVSAAIADELHAFTTAQQEELWAALWTAMHKRIDSYGLICTTAGYDKDSLLGRMYDEAMKLEAVPTDNPCLQIRKDEENGTLLWWYGAPKDSDIDDEAIWRQCNPASWISIRDLSRQLHSPSLGELDFRRLHLNQWTKTRDAWLEAGLWDSLRDDSATIPDRADVFLGVDVGLIHDSTAVAVAHRRSDGRIVVKAHVWTAKDDALGEYVPGGRVQLEAVEAHIIELAKRYKVREVAYDPRFFERSAQTLSDAGLLMLALFQSSAPMADAYQTFYAACREDKVLHDGDPVLSSHVENTAADKTERGWRVRKLRSSARIDACVAAAIAVWRASVSPIKKRGGFGF